MKAKRFTEEQIIGILNEAEQTGTPRVLQAKSTTTVDLALYPIVRVQEPSPLDPDRFPRVLVDDRREPKPPSIRRLIREPMALRLGSGSAARRHGALGQITPAAYAAGVGRQEKRAGPEGQ